MIDFLEICNTFKVNKIFKDVIYLQLFPFFGSRRGQAVAKFLAASVNYYIGTNSREVLYPLFSFDEDH